MIKNKNIKIAFFTVIVLSAILGIVYCIANYTPAIKISTITNNEKCFGRRLKNFKGSNISSYSCGLFLTDDGIAYKCEEDMSGLQRVDCLDGVKKLSKAEGVSVESTTYALFNDGVIKVYDGEACYDMEGGDKFFWTDIASAYRFVAMLNDAGEVWIKDKSKRNFYMMDLEKNICSIYAYGNTLYFTDEEGTVYYYAYNSSSESVDTNNIVTVGSEKNIQRVYPNKQYIMLFDTSGNVFYHGSIFGALAPKEYAEAPKNTFLFDNIKDMACTEYFAYILTDKDKLYMYHGFDTDERLYEISDSVDKIIYGGYGALIVENTEGEYFMYKTEIR